MNVTIIDKNGYIISPLEKIIDGEIKDFKMDNNYLSVKYVSSYQTVFIKPRWNGTSWVEGATDEEIQAWQEENKAEDSIQATEEQQLLSTVLLENAEIKEQLAEQQELTANLLLQVASLGGNADV